MYERHFGGDCVHDVIYERTVNEKRLNITVLIELDYRSPMSAGKMKVSELVTIAVFKQDNITQWDYLNGGSGALIYCDQMIICLDCMHDCFTFL